MLFRRFPVALGVALDRIIVSGDGRATLSPTDVMTFMKGWRPETEADLATGLETLTHFTINLHPSLGRPRLTVGLFLTLVRDLPNIVRRFPEALGMALDHLIVRPAGGRAALSASEAVTFLVGWTPETEADLVLNVQNYTSAPPQSTPSSDGRA